MSVIEHQIITVQKRLAIEKSRILVFSPELKRF